MNEDIFILSDSEAEQLYLRQLEIDEQLIINQNNTK